AWPDGSVLLPARAAAAEDVIALLCDAAFEASDPRRRPPSEACRAALAERRMVVALDDVRSAAELASLQAALGSSLLFVSTSRPWNVAGVEWIGLQGLASHGVSLLQAAAGGDVPGDLAAAVVHALEGNPSRIVRAARLALPLETIAASCTSARAFDELLLARAGETLSREERLALAATATFGDVALGAEGPPSALVEAGLLERSPLGWAVPAGLREGAAALEPDAALLASALLERLARQDGGPVDAGKLLAAVPGLLSALERDGAPAGQAGRTVATMLDRHGLWAASRELCEALRVLARKLEDPGTWAWAMHQLGARCACAGDLAAARALFAGALAARQFNGDEPGCAVTVGDLALLSGRAESVAAAEAETEPAALAHSNREAPGVRREPARDPRPGTPPAAVALALLALGVVLVVLLWPSLRPPERQRVAGVLGSASPGAAAPASPPEDTPATVVAAPARALNRPSPRVRPSAPATAHPPAAPVVDTPAVRPQDVVRARTPPRHRALPQLAKKRAERRPRVSLMTLLPSTIAPHEKATLCVSAAGADELYVTGLGELRPDQTTCRTVSPAATTTYAAEAVGAAWKATRTITLTVTPE
ncbi:MAG: hypothetical protein WAN59_08445, partial [Candidatus Baltobacteraceae bacterium]